MSDDNMKVAIDLDVRSTGEELVAQLTRQLSKLESQIKSINAASKSAANASRTSSSGRNPSSAGASTAQGEAKAKRQTLIFGREEAKLFRSRMTSQARATADAMRAERQSFADYKSRIAAKAKHEASEVRALKDRMTAESRIAGMRARSESDAVRVVRNEIATRSRITKQRIAEESAVARNAAASEAASIRAVREKIAANTRMARQRMKAERDVARESARAAADAQRDHENALRRRISGDRWRFQLRDRMERQAARDRQNARSTAYYRGNDALNHGGNAYSRLSRPGAVAAAAGTAASMGLGRKALGAEADIDAAEINSRIYAGLSKDAARDLRDKWAAPLAESLGVNTAKMLTSFTDAVKLGIPTEGAKQFSELATKTSEAWGVPFENVTDILGTVNTLLTSTGEAFNYDKLKSTANTLQYLAAKQSTTPEKLMSFMQRGAGAAQVLGMSQEAGLAFGSASTSLGNQAGQSGRMFDYVASRLIEMPRLTKKKGDEGKQARDLIRSLGYSSADDMDRNRRASPDKFLPDFMERFSKIQNPKKQEEAIRFFTGREWMGEFGRMVKGNSTYKEAAKLAEEAKGLDAIGEVWELHRTKLSFVFKQFKAGWLNILGEFGKVLSPLARQAGDYFLEWSRKLQSGGLQARFRAAIDGLIEGFGFKDLPDMLKGMFGTPGEGEAGTVEKWKATAKAFAEGIRDVFGTIKGIASTLSGGDPEVIARWTGRIIALSAALLVLGPVLGILGGIISLVVGLSRAATAIRALVGLGGGAATGATAGAATGAGLLFKGLGLTLSRLFALGVVAEIGSNKEVISAWLLEAGKNILQAAIDGLKSAFSKEAILAAMKAITSEFIPAPVERWLNKDGKLEEKGGLGKKTLEGLPKGIPAAPVDPNERGYIGKAWDWLSSSLVGSAAASELPPGLRGQVNTATATPKASVGNELVEALEDNTNAIRSNLDRQGIMGSLIHRASITTASDGVKASLSDSANGVKQAAVLSGSTGSGVMTGGNGPLGNSTGGSALNGGSGLSRRGILGGGGDGGGYAPASNSMAGKTFDAKAPGIMANLQKDFGLTKEQAAGILGNLGHESAGMTAYQEGKPLGGGRGGAGWAQWTGPRRRAFEAWSAQNGLDSRSDEANYGFLKHELQTTHKGSLASLRRQSTVDGATVDFERNYEAAGVKHYGSRIGYARKAFNGPSAPSQVIGGTVGTDAASNVAANAEKLVGLGSSQAAQALGSKMTPGSWCADFVNGSLKSANIKGVNSSIANSFLSWGREVTDGVRKGDVLVEHRGRGVGMPGGHAGIATGQTRQGPRGLQYEMVSGNHGNRVGRSWEDAGKVVARRAMESTTAAVEAAKFPDLDGFTPPKWKAPVGSISSGLTDKAESVRSNGWRPKQEAPSTLVDGPPGSAPMARPSLADSVPPRNIDAPNVSGHRGGNASGGASSSSSSVINVNGAGMSAEAVANAVQRRLNEGMNRRTHDLDPSMI